MGSMEFIQTNPRAAVAATAERLIAELKAGKHVVWLVSGSSNISLEVDIMSRLRHDVSSDLQKLTILPADERYGAPGHVNSNTAAMRQAGFLTGAAEWIDILAHDVSFDETIEYYENVVSESFARAHCVIGQFGLGSDGHTAGILPDSPACDEDYATVVGYEWHDYVRLTLSPRALTEVNVAFVAAYGSSKRTALERLQANREPLTALPAALLYNIPEVYVYNDHIESEG